MKKILLILCVLLVACQEKQEQKTPSAPLEQTATIEEKKPVLDSKQPTPQKNNPSKKTTALDTLLGYYVGQFQAVEINHDKGAPSYSNKITISIDEIKENSIYGHSVVAGGKREFEGVIDPQTLFAKVVEPGDNKYDGIFSFTFFAETQQIEGTWVANDQDITVTKRKFTLEKRTFEYNPTLNLAYNEEHEYHIMPLFTSQEEESGETEAIDANLLKDLNASVQQLTPAAIENLRKGELAILRNLIYARHGYSFKNRKMRYFFDNYIAWYMPISTDVREELTTIEHNNIALIKRYEQHADRYYDYFGR